MSELDDLEEFNWSPSREGNVRKRGNARKYFLAAVERSVKRPRWKQQLSIEKGWDDPHHKRAPK